MVIPGLFVEYLVIGACALFWTLPFADGIIPNQMTEQKTLIVLLFPASYVLGMWVDVVGMYITTRLPSKKMSLLRRVRQTAVETIDREINHAKLEFADTLRVEGFLDESSKPPKLLFPFLDGGGRSQRGKMWAQFHDAELIKDLEMRCSRDRIARGSSINLFLIGVVHFSLAFGDNPEWLDIVVGGVIWLLVLSFSLYVWAFCVGESYRYELRCGISIIKRLNTEKRYTEAKTQ